MPLTLSMAFSIVWINAWQSLSIAVGSNGQTCQMVWPDNSWLSFCRCLPVLMLACFDKLCSGVGGGVSDPYCETVVLYLNYYSGVEVVGSRALNREGFESWVLPLLWRINNWGYVGYVSLPRGSVHRERFKAEDFIQNVSLLSYN